MTGGVYSAQSLDIQISNSGGSGAQDLGVYSFGTADVADYPFRNRCNSGITRI
jgi:hypothetical protein